MEIYITIEYLGNVPKIDRFQFSPLKGLESSRRTYLRSNSSVRLVKTALHYEDVINLNYKELPNLGKISIMKSVGMDLFVVSR